jgi:hypothetical protein
MDLLGRWFVSMGSGGNGSECVQCLAFVQYLWFMLPQHEITVINYLTYASNNKL